VLVGAGLSVLESGEVGVRNLYFALATTPSLVSSAPVVAGRVS
jgi:hypothetical protein